VAFSSATYSVAENAGPAIITVNLSGPSSQTIMVYYATSDGNATAGSDYTAVGNGTLIFNLGETTKTFEISITDDSIYEGAETVYLALSSFGNANPGSPNTAILTIIDNETPPGGGTTPSPTPKLSPTATPRYTATPTPVRTPSPTTTPTPTSEPSRTPAPMDFDLRGSTNENGVVTLAQNLTFNTGEANIEIPGGTKPLTFDRKPLGTVQLLTIANPPTLPDNCRLIGLAYDFKPNGATFDPFITITLKYDPNSLPEGVSEQNMCIAYTSTSSGFWYRLQSVVDPVNHSISAQATHFTVFAILADTTQQSSALAIGWSLIGGIIGGFILLAVILYLGYFRRQGKKQDA
jgi:hypothetical protein